MRSSGSITGQWLFILDAFGRSLETWLREKDQGAYCRIEIRGCESTCSFNIFTAWNGWREEFRRREKECNSSLIPLIWTGKSELSQDLANQDHQIWLELSVSRGQKPGFGKDAMELDSAPKCNPKPTEDAHTHINKAAALPFRPLILL